MSCVHPFKAFRTGFLTENGKEDLIMCHWPCPDFISTDKVHKPIDYSRAHYFLRDGATYLCDPIEVPCGSCNSCRMQKAKEWKIRNCLELQDHDEAWFITLTFDDAHLGDNSLDKKELQDFLKRLRYYLGDKFRYFASGEYGDTTLRKHYHILLYCHLGDLSLIGVNRYTCDCIGKAWPFGQHLVEPVTPGSIAYVCGYVEKKLDKSWPIFAGKPFVTMSRRPGIGMSWLERHKSDLERSFKVYGIFGDDVRNNSASVPQAFKRKLDGLPWFEELKEASRLASDDIVATQRVIYGIYSREHISFAQEAGLDYKNKLHEKEKIL